MISDEKFDFLKSETFKILSKFSLKETILSNSFLYIVRKQDFSLSKFELLNNKFFFIIGWLILLKDILKFLAQFFFFYNFKKKIFSEKKLLFISHILNEKKHFSNSENDFYFKHILSALKKKDYDIFYLNHAKKKQNKPTVINQKKSLVIELNIVFNLIKNFLFLFKIIFKSNEFNKKFLFFLLFNNFNSDNINNLRIFYNIKKILNYCTYKKIIITFEGHAYERMIIKAAKDINLNIKVIAYNHATIFKDQPSIHNIISKDTTPDIILTSGYNSQKLLSKSYQKSGIKVNTIGSNRFIERNNPSFKLKKKCLVLPEGLNGELDFFFNFCKLILTKFIDYEFIFRVHPIHQDYAINLLNISNLGIYKNNIKLSNNENMYDDFKNCDSFFYRGTSIAVQAARYGLIPIFIYDEKKYNNNIFYNHDKYIITVKNVDDAINNLKNLNSFNFSNNFTDTYFSSIDISKFNSLIDA